MNSNSPKGILVTGAPRSGTSWVGRMLALASNTKYLHEPMNNTFAVGHFKEEPFPYWFMYLNEQNQSQYIERISRMIELSPSVSCSSTKNIARTIPIIKDPIAVFSSEWLARTYDLEVVFLIRHPCAFIKSLLTLEWNTEPEIFFRQQSLMDAFLSEYDAELRAYQNQDNKIAQAALTWKMIYHAAHVFQERNSEWLFVRHEDLSIDPNGEFKTIFSKVGLEYTDIIAKEITDHSSPKNPVNPDNHWNIQRDSKNSLNTWFDYFTKEQISEIRELVEPLSSIYYQDNEWPER